MDFIRVPAAEGVILIRTWAESIIKRKEVYVLADSSKFGGGYLSVICPINAVHKIITDSHVSKENIAIAKEMKVPLVIAKE